MARFRFDLTTVSAVRKKLQLQTAHLQRKAAFGMVNWAQDTIGEIKREIIRVGAFDRGELHGSVTYSPPRTVGKSKVRLFVLVNKEYASVIEFGRRPRSGKPPPLKALIGWAKRKGLVKALPVNPNLSGELGKKLGAARKIRENSFKRAGKGRKPKKKCRLLDPIIRDFLVLLGIQEGIQQRGIKGRTPFTRVFDRRKKTFVRDIIRFVNRGP